MQRRRIAHISDLHFGKISFNPAHIFSKRWIGMLNLLLTRRKHYLNSRPWSVLDAFEELEVTDVIISGDLTTTSYSKEYEMANAFVDALHERNISTYLIPGNHDHYTRHSYRKKVFYSHYPETYDASCPFSLKEHGVTYFSLPNKWHVVLLDTVLATSLYLSIGYFSPKVEDALEEALSQIPNDSPIVLVNHFPFFQHESPRRRLKRGGVLQSILRRHPNIRMYLHGHTHRHVLADLRENGLPLVIDSGSISHKNQGTWNLLDLTDDQCMVYVYSYDKKAPLQWKAIHQKLFSW